jgi:hypothetical protein
MDTRPGSGAPEARHETRDANIRALLIFAAALVATVLVVAFAMVRTFKYFETTQSEGSSTSPFAKGRPLPPQPQLQVEPRVDLLELRVREEAKLHSYGWVDRSAGVVHIPIERAMDLALEKGFPVRGEREVKK